MVGTRRGSVSAYVLLCMGVILTAGISVSSLAVGSLRRVRIDRTTVSAQQAAFASLDHAIGSAWVNLEDNNGNFVEGEHDLTSIVDDFAPGVSATAQVEPLPDPRWAWVTGTATLNGVTRSVRSFLASKNVSIWNNAVFAGSGAAGRAINGNVDIRGSVHILGEGEAYIDLNGNGNRDAAETFTDNNGNGTWDPGEPFVDANNDGVWNPAEPYNDTNLNGFYDPPLTQTDLNSSFSGTAQIANHYSGMPVFLEAYAPALPVIGGKETLETEVRVKHGLISINGTANIGESVDPDGGTSKGKIDGSYVNDGFTGNLGSTAVYSDNGTTNTYDLGNLNMEMPLLSGIGASAYTDSSGGSWANHESYLNSRSLVLTTAQLPGGRLDDATPGFSLGPDAYGNRISYTPPTSSGSGYTPGRLTVIGVVKFDPGVTGYDLQIGTSKSTLYYEGNGTFYSPKSINIDANFLPVPGKKFPADARVGLIAKNDVNLATGAGAAQLALAGAFYAQGTVRSAKQNQVLGSFVANNFDMGTNVPNIYQVPSLATNLPPAMPGDRMYYTIKVRSFRDRSPAPGTSYPTTTGGDGGPISGTTGGSTGGSTSGGYSSGDLGA